MHSAFVSSSILNKSNAEMVPGKMLVVVVIAVVVPLKFSLPLPVILPINLALTVGYLLSNRYCIKRLNLQICNAEYIVRAGQKPTIFFQNTKKI